MLKKQTKNPYKITCKDPFHQKVISKMIGQVKRTNPFSCESFHHLYLSSNELIDNYLSAFDLKGKKVLTVGSSGDQVLFALAHGASEVVCLDINIFAKYFYEYKAAGIKKYPYYRIQGMLKDDEDYFTKRYFKAVQNELSPETKEFWNAAFENGLESKQWALSTDSTLISKSIHKDEAAYTRIREALQHPHTVRHIYDDVRHLDRKLGSEDKFDLILLSNICEYIGLEKPLWKTFSKPYYEKNIRASLLDVIRQAKGHLLPNGSIQVDYRWYTLVLQTSAMKKHLDKKDEGKIWYVDTVPKDRPFQEGAIFYTPDKTDVEYTDE